jgi:hypothetical protein
MKTESVFFPKNLIERARENATNYEWAADIKQTIINEAQPWLKYSDDELWDMGFSPHITRSWMVWSDGHCPDCQNTVTMYHWKIDPHKNPWKVQCPHCESLFPKNDFHAYNQSGSNEQGIFEPALGDRSLLFNQEEPDGPKRDFGVDDGEGYVEGENRWRFIGAYLIYGQWKKLILGGVEALSAAFILTGDIEYSRRTAILLDRVADIYPTYDFRTQGLVYEHRVPKPDHNFSFDGYVSNWHDCPKEVIVLAEAYDRISPAIDDERLIRFLSEKAKLYHQENAKDSASAIRQNIENRILKESLTNKHKIDGNVPSQEHAILVIESILGWVDNRDHIDQLFDQLLDVVTAIDGVTGEKGISGYATIGPRNMVKILGKFNRIEPEFLSDILRRNPRLHDHFRFHIDTWCLHKFYPGVGDAKGFNQEPTGYAGVEFGKAIGLEPSAYTVLGELHQLTNDPAFAQILYGGNNNTLDGLPHDLFTEDPLLFQDTIQKIVDKHGTQPSVGSINLKEWHLAILRSGEAENARALSLGYDTLRNHHHADTMNLSLFAKGLDLLPDFGYPPVQYGGWDSPQAKWYKKSTAHNTVVVDGKDSREGTGKTTLWIDGKSIQTMRMSAPEAIDGEQYERTASLVDISEEDAYVIDIFRVIGGSDHARLLHSYVGDLTTEGLNLQQAEDYGYDTLMRHFQSDSAPPSGWSADWKINNKQAQLPTESEIHLRTIDVTTGATAYTSETWVSSGFQDTDVREFWIPTVIARRQGAAPLHSTFVSIIEPYSCSSNIKGVRRLPLQTEGDKPCGDSQVAVEIELTTGQRDLLIALDPNQPLASVRQPDWDVDLTAELCWLRRDAIGHLQRATITKGKLQSGGFTLETDSEFIEKSF